VLEELVWQRGELVAAAATAPHLSKIDARGCWFWKNG
jgi:hypothetical protein